MDVVSQVCDLRSSGKTYKDICNATGLKKGKVGYICRRYCEKNDVIVERHKGRSKGGNNGSWELKRFSATAGWTEKISSVDPIRVAYAYGLYMGEGNHTGNDVVFTNSDPELIQDWISFLRLVGADHRADLTLHATHDEKRCRKFWERVTPLNNVFKVDTRKQKKAGKRSKPNHGTCRVLVTKPLGFRVAFLTVGRALVS